MLAFGSAITKPDVYASCARPGIDAAREADSVVLEHESRGTIFTAYNALLDQARALDDLEALVLLHQDTELVDGARFAPIVRAALADPAVALVGCAGAVGVRSIAWWEGSITLASFVHRHDQGDVPSVSWDWDTAPAYARLGEVDTLDGFLLVLSPWAVRELRFDEALGPMHGYDADFCLQARAAGKKVVTADLRAIHHHALEPFGDPEGWIAAHTAVAEKWAGVVPGFGTFAGTWRERAITAEAEAQAYRAADRGDLLEQEARARELESALAEARGSISWRLAAPLRRRVGES